jgi:hypothetical protein
MYYHKQKIYYLSSSFQFMHEAIRYPGYHGKIGRILIHHWLEPVRNENPAPDKPDCRWVYMQLNSTTVSLVAAPVILVGLLSYETAGVWYYLLCPVKLKEQKVRVGVSS